MPNANDIAQNMVSALRATEPDLDTSIGTPIRKILDAVSESIAEGYIDQHLINYQYDVDTKTGGDLDTFCALFGITRIPAQRAQGIVTFSRPNDNYAQTTICVIPPASQVAALVSPPVYAQSVVGATMDVGQLSIDVPMQAVSAGSSGNAPAKLLNTLVASLSGITKVFNSAPFSGGMEAESDDQLRQRFKQTVFRSMAGTMANYQAIAQTTPSDPSTPNDFVCSRANIIGSTKRWREQLQIVNGQATSTVSNAAYIYASNFFCGLNIDGGSLLTPGVDYTFTPTNPTNSSNASAILKSISANMPDGLYDLDFEYVPQASRNDPAATRFNQGGVSNRIDIWCNGLLPVTATQNVVFLNTFTFNNTAGSAYNANLFTSSNPNAVTPPTGSIFIPLIFTAIQSVPQTLTIANVVYTLGSDYWIVHRNDAFGYAPNSTQGLVWTTTAARIPPNNSVFTISYAYNSAPYKISEAVQQWRQLGTDTIVHAGKRVLIKFNLAIVYDRRFDPASVTGSINAALASSLSALGFDAPLQVSDVLQTVHNVPGVDNVRFLTSTDDSTNYAMQNMSPYTGNLISTYAKSGRVIDIQFADDQYPVLHSVNLVQKASNTFMVNA